MGISCMAWLPEKPEGQHICPSWIWNEKRRVLAAVEVRLLQKKADGFTKWVRAGCIDAICIPTLLCDLYSPKVVALTSGTANDVTWVWLSFRVDQINIPANNSLGG